MAAISAAACGERTAPLGDPAREQSLDRAFALADSNPAQASALFADVGPGTSLETARMAVWAACLERTGAGPEEWRGYLQDRPPRNLAQKAHLALIAALVERGEARVAARERHSLPEASQTRADEILFEADDPAIRLEAATRLAVSSPAFLAAADAELDRRLVARLAPPEALARAEAWRLAGRASRGAAELRRLRWQGEQEQSRRRELARAELAAGSPSAALNALPSGSRAGIEDHVLRARASRNRAWHLFPGRGELRHFRDCVSSAAAAVATDGAAGQRRDALILHLECATQAGQLETAVKSWRLLEAEAWDDSRRSWLGRRLGLALIHSNPEHPAIDEMLRSLPVHERCFRFWRATHRGQETSTLSELADVAIADLYGQWAHQILGRSPAGPPTFGAEVTPADPPSSVRRLLAVGSKSEALRQWRRIRRARLAEPREALKAAELAAAHGWSTDAIRWLRVGFPELGTIEMNRSPEHAVELYLPLRWQAAVIAAAQETGLDPWLIAGVARQESGFVAHARSPRGAVGILQILPSTARLHGRALGLGQQPDLLDPEVNLRLGARELSFLVRRFGAMEPALAAYNGGLTRVRDWWKRWPDRQRFTEEIPVPETYNYVRRVTFLSEAYRLAYDDEWRSTQ